MDVGLFQHLLETFFPSLLSIHFVHNNYFLRTSIHFQLRGMLRSSYLKKSQDTATSEEEILTQTDNY